MLKAKIDQDIKAALLAGDTQRVTVLRGLKSAVLYVEVEKGAREQGLSDEAVLTVLGKEAKKRQESADLYQQGGDGTRAAAELAEKAIIEEYLPSQLDDTELKDLVSKVCEELQADSPQLMGKVIAEVKQRAAGRADGARIAQLVKERLTN